MKRAKYQQVRIITPEDVKKLLGEAFEKEESEASVVPIKEKDSDVLPEEKTDLSQDELAGILVQQERENLKRSQQSTKHLEEIHDTRKTYTQKLFRLNLSWILIITFVIFVSGLRVPYFNDPTCQEKCFGFALSENILIAFITSTTATVIGIFLIVAKWLFPSAHQDTPLEKKEK